MGSPRWGLPRRIGAILFLVVGMLIPRHHTRLWRDDGLTDFRHLRLFGLECCGLCERNHQSTFDERQVEEDLGIAIVLAGTPLVLWHRLSSGSHP
jgi:hypothetical protein